LSDARNPTEKLIVQTPLSGPLYVERFFVLVAMFALDQSWGLREPDGETTTARGPSLAERTARGAIEEGLGHRLTEKQWAEHRRRLVEFVQTLARWDRVQQSLSHAESDGRS
jgi:hypothetical protein